VQLLAESVKSSVERVEAQAYVELAAAMLEKAEAQRKLAEVEAQGT
jgi:hypothetical protein